MITTAHSVLIGINLNKEVCMELQTGYTDEEICKSLMSELKGLSDAEWAMLDDSDNASTVK